MKPIYLDQTNLIVQAVAPLKADAQERAAKEAQKLVDFVTTELAKVGNDLQKCAPYPRSFNMGREEYTKKKSRYQLFRAFVSHREGSRGINDAELADVNAERIAKFIESAKADAALQYDGFVSKLVAKVGSVVSASLDGNHVWEYSVLRVVTVGGVKESWKTQQIVNVSKLGTLYNQWPTRKVK